MTRALLLAIVFALGVFLLLQIITNAATLAFQQFVLASAITFLVLLVIGVFLLIRRGARSSKD